MNRITCWRCNGDEHVLSEHSVTVQCPICLGEGWLSMPRALVSPSIALPGALLALVVFAVIVASSLVQVRL